MLYSPSASANNHADTSFQFGLNAHFAKYTGSRNKTDASSVYVYVRNVTKAKDVACFAVGPNFENVSSSVVVLRSGTAAKISQYAYENGYRKVRLGVRNNSSWGASTVSGLWSPDSI